jgi:hypothetical protein
MIKPIPRISRNRVTKIKPIAARLVDGVVESMAAFELLPPEPVWLL